MRRICRKFLFWMTLGLLSFSGGALPVHAADWSQGVVIRADRIEIKGLIPLLAGGNDGGPVLRLIAGEAKGYGMRMGAAHQDLGWGLEIADGGRVPIRGLQVDATVLGFRIEGPPIQLGESIPSIVLYDVFMKVDQLDAKQIDLHKLEMSTQPEVSLKPDGPVLDLRPIAKFSKEKMEKEVNERLSELATELPKDGPDGKEGPETDGKGKGSDAPNNITDPDSDSDSQPAPNPDPGVPNLPEPVPGEGGDDSENRVEEKVKLTKTIGLVRANKLVREVRKYDASVMIKRGRKEAKADDYWGVVRLGLIRGMEIVLTAGGNEARQAADAVARFLTGR